MHNNDSTTPTFGLSLHVRGRKSEEVTIADRHEAALKCVFFIESMFTVLSLVGTDFTRRMDSTDLTTSIEVFCELGKMLSEETCVHIEKLEDEREELTKALGEGRTDAWR